MAGSAVFNGTTAFGKYQPGGNILTTLPITVCAWAKASIAQSKCIGGFEGAGGLAGNIRQLNANGAALRNGFGFPIGGTFVNDGSAWNSLVGVFTASDTIIYVGGLLGATDTNDIAAANHLAILAGADTLAAPANFFAGKIAHLSVHNAAFALLDAQRHAAGWAANRLPSPFAWYKLETNGQDSIAGQNMTLTDVTFDSDGPVIQYDNDWTATMRNLDRLPDSTPHDRLRILRTNRRKD